MKRGFRSLVRNVCESQPAQYGLVTLHSLARLVAAHSFWLTDRIT